MTDAFLGAEASRGEPRRQGTPQAFLGVLGHVNVDYLFHLPEPLKPNATHPITARERFWGGTAGNIAVAAATLGVPTRLGSVVGEDFPAEYRDWLRARGVDLSDLVALPGRPTSAWWGFEDPEHNVLGIIDQGPLGGDDLAAEFSHALQAPWVHFATGPPKAWLRLVAKAKDAGRNVTFDPGQELRYRWGDRDFERMLDRSDMFVCNHVELEQALDKLAYGDVVQLHDHVPVVLVTRGKEGATLHREGERRPVAVPAVPRTEAPVVDTTGAGDGFRAGVYAGLHHGLDLAACVALGNAVASFVIEAKGAQTNLPTYAQAEARARGLAPGRK